MPYTCNINTSVVILLRPCPNTRLILWWVDDLLSIIVINNRVEGEQPNVLSKDPLFVTIWSTTYLNSDVFSKLRTGGAGGGSYITGVSPAAVFSWAAMSSRNREFGRLTCSYHQIQDYDETRGELLIVGMSQTRRFDHLRYVHTHDSQIECKKNKNGGYLPSRTTIRSARAIVDNRWATKRHVVCRDCKILSTASFTFFFISSSVSQFS